MAYDPLTPTTKLEAVNNMLISIGLSMVDTYTDTNVISVETAVQILDETTREVLSEGWHFNTDDEYPLAYTASGNDKDMISVPSGAISVDPDCKDYVQRWNPYAVTPGWFLYDRKNHTFTITADVNSKVIWSFIYEQIPDLIRRYVYCRAGRKFQSSEVASQVIHQITMNDELDAKRAALKIEEQTQDNNLLYGNIETAWIHSRNMNPYRG